MPGQFPAPFSTVRFSEFAGEIMMGVPLAIALTDNSGNLMIRNEAFRVTVGSDDCVGGRIESVVVEAYQSIIRSAFERSMKRREPIEIRAAVPNRPEEVQIILIQPLPISVSFGAIISMRDVREQLRVEAQVAAATRMQAVGQLAGGIAHDFNNILTAVLMQTDHLLVLHPPGDDDHGALAEIRRNSLRAAALVEQLLAFARRQPQRQQLLDVVVVIEGLRSLITQLVGSAITVIIEGKSLVSAVLADPGQIEQVIVNLAVNARDAMTGSGRLTIRCRDIAAADIVSQGHRIIPAVGHVRIDVIDTGTGISPEIAGKIFEPFFTTKPLGEGTGLGLSTVYGIVKQSSGYVFAMPAEEAARGASGERAGDTAGQAVGADRGTMFSIYLPAATELVGVTVAPAPPLLLRDDTGIAGLHVLLVEDDSAVRITLERALKHMGLVVVAVSSADPALELLTSQSQFDILVSDVMMAGVDGVELAAQAQVLRPGIAVLLISGYAELPLHRAADAQGVRFLAKPFSLLELRNALTETVLPAH